MELRNDIEEIEDIEEIGELECIENNKVLVLKKKKKGFTLVELIAVIAILAILGAIIVPQIFGYMARADRAKVQTDAAIVVSAIQTFNADNSGAAAITTVDAAAQTAIGTAVTIPAYLITANLSVAQLTVVASGTTITTKGGFTVTKAAGVYTVAMIP